LKRNKFFALTIVHNYCILGLYFIRQNSTAQYRDTTNRQKEKTSPCSNKNSNDERKRIVKLLIFVTVFLTN